MIRVLHHVKPLHGPRREREGEDEDADTQPERVLEGSGEVGPGAAQEGRSRHEEHKFQLEHGTSCVLNYFV